MRGADLSATRTVMAGSVKRGDRILDPVDGTPRTVARTVGAAPLIALFMTDPGHHDVMVTMTLTDLVTLAD